MDFPLLPGLLRDSAIRGGDDGARHRGGVQDRLLRDPLGPAGRRALDLDMHPLRPSDIRFTRPYRRPYRPGLVRVWFGLPGGQRHRPDPTFHSALAAHRNGAGVHPALYFAFLPEEFPPEGDGPRVPPSAALLFGPVLLQLRPQ